MVTTIQIEENTKKVLDRLKVHHRESYNELVLRLASNYSNEEEDDSETIEILSDPETMRDIASALEDYEKGKRKTLKEFRKEIGV